MSYQADKCLVHMHIRGEKIGTPLNCVSAYKHKKCRCKNCVEFNRNQSEIFRKNNPEKHRKYSNNWSIKNSDYKKSKHKEWYEKNRKDQIEKTKIWQSINKEKKREYALKTQNKRRAIKNMSSHIPYTISEILSKYGTACHICKEEIDFKAPRSVGQKKWQKSFHIDHLIPMSKGGHDFIDNVRPSHAECNLRKSSNIL